MRLWWAMRLEQSACLESDGEDSMEDAFKWIEKSRRESAECPRGMQESREGVVGSVLYADRTLVASAELTALATANTRSRIVTDAMHDAIRISLVQPPIKIQKLPIIFQSLCFFSYFFSFKDSQKIARGWAFVRL